MHAFPIHDLSFDNCKLHHSILSGGSACRAGSAGRWLYVVSSLCDWSQVCLDSAKVRLNSGILERRYMNWTGALEHFSRARAIEPGYCDPTYWVGITLLNSGQIAEGVQELEAALSCKYVAANALEALNKFYAAMLELQPNNPASFQVPAEHFSFCIFALLSVVLMRGHPCLCGVLVSVVNDMLICER